jgi:A/G-specific adenine glycosylase
MTISAALLAWWDAGHADLPWRRTRDPYAIWVAEIMLQQTQIATVLPYYERWMARFPTVQALAAAPLADALKLWEGLGYYSPRAQPPRRRADGRRGARRTAA